MFLVAPGDINVTGNSVAARGDSTSFMCSNRGGPNNSYQWSLNDVLLRANSSVLYLTQVDANFGGYYTCLVTNTAGMNSSFIILNIEPYIVTFPQLYLEIELSDPAMFSCTADGFPLPDISWMKVAGSQMNSIVSTTGNLTFSSVAAEDNGTYICIASAQALGPERLQLQIVMTPESVLIGNCE